MSTTTLRYHAVKNKVEAVHIAIPWKAAYLLAGIFVVAMLALYIFRVNQLTQGAYTIKKYNKELASLSVQQSNLETSFAQSSFLGKAQDAAIKLDFEKTTDIIYIKILQGSLAEAK